MVPFTIPLNSLHFREQREPCYWFCRRFGTFVSSAVRPGIGNMPQLVSSSFLTLPAYSPSTYFPFSIFYVPYSILLPPQKKSSTSYVPTFSLLAPTSPGQTTSFLSSYLSLLPPPINPTLVELQRTNSHFSCTISCKTP